MPKYPKVNYIGNKERLVEWILDEMPLNKGTVLDMFAGGCSVSYALKQKGYSVIVNDILYADYVIAKALIENDSVQLGISVFDQIVREDRIAELEGKLEFLSGCLYYPEEIKELAGLVAISETLEGHEKYLFLALLRRAMIRKLPYSRMNVPWNQIERLRDEAYSYQKYGRKRAYHNQSFESHMKENLDAYNDAIFKTKKCSAFHMDALELIKKMESVDIVYMDPPYPSTMNNYDAFYGMFDEMFDMRKPHVDYTQKSVFIDCLEELIDLLKGKTKYIVLSQNSRVKPDVTDIKKMLCKYGSVEVKEKSHNYQVTGKEHKNGSKELLLILKLDARIRK